MAPEVGLEPTTLRLTAACSTIELLRNAVPEYMNANLKLGLPALAAVLLVACSGTSSSTNSGATAAATSPTASASLLRAIWVLSPVGLSLRDNPSTTGQVLAHLPQGTQLTATEFRAGSPGWYHVTYNGSQGWVADKDTRSIPIQALVTSRAQLAYANPAAGYYFLYPATWGVSERGSDVELDSPLPNGQSPEPQASGAAPVQGITPTRLIVHVAADVGSLGQVPTTSGSIIDTLDFEVGGITSVKRTFTLSGGGYEGDVRVGFAPAHAVLITLRSGAQQDLDIFTEVLSSFGFSIRAGGTPSPG